MQPSEELAHEFNNLLGVILNYTTLIARRVTDPVIAADLAEIRGAAERCVDLTRQLLAIEAPADGSTAPRDA